MRILGVILAALLAFSTASCGSSGEGGKEVKATEAASPAADETSAESTPEPPARHALKKSDLGAKVKVRSKQCFGSAGCNVEVAVELGWAILDPGKLDGDYDVTYKVMGDESGPIIATITLYPNGKYTTNGTTFMSTPSSDTPIKVVITRVERA